MYVLENIFLTGSYHDLWNEVGYSTKAFFF